MFDPYAYLKISGMNLCLWLHCDVTGNDGKTPLSFPWPTGKSSWCLHVSVDPAESPFMVPCRQPLWTLNSEPFPLHGFQFFVSDDTKFLQCNVLSCFSYVMIIYIYKWLLMCCRLFSSDILCFKTKKKHIQTSFTSVSICCSSIIRWRRVWRGRSRRSRPSTAGCAGSEKILVICFGGKIDGNCW